MAHNLYLDLSQLLGHAIRGDMDNILKTIYYNGAVWETNRRALTDAFEMMKKVNQDPNAMLSAFLKIMYLKLTRLGTSWKMLQRI